MVSANVERGFTLLEVLVSVAIIGILSGVMYVSFSSARESSSNKAMMTEVKEMQLAIERYRAQNGRYPVPETAGGCGSGMTLITSSESACAVPFIRDLAPTFIEELPEVQQSSNGSCQIEYVTDLTGSRYKLSANECLSGMTIGTDNEMALCPSTCSNTASGQECEVTAGFGQSFAVYSLGGECL